MSFSDKDYYQILGISPDANSKDIKERYKKLMMENHPDRFKGLKAKYQAEGDEVLLEVLEEKIRQADEACKFINEAYEALSDPALRKAYDEEAYEPKVPVPEIVVSPTEISFGTLNEGQRKSKSFTIENKGGPAVAVEINWEDDSDWGELFIEPDPEEIFPIKVTIKVDTTGIPSGLKAQRIYIKVNGTSHAVEVLLNVVVVEQASAPRVKVAFAGTSLPSSRGSINVSNSLVLVAWVFSFLFFVIQAALENTTSLVDTLLFTPAICGFPSAFFLTLFWLWEKLISRIKGGSKST